jgi:hypothetical protein
MGAFGSGKWADAMTRKATTGLCRTLNAKRLKEAGVFDGDLPVSIAWVNEWGEDAGFVTITRQSDGHGNTSHLRLESGGSVTVTASIIRVTTTPCFYGGVRYWLLCPAVRDGLLCENRVGALYLPPGGSVFGCRHCWGLTYDSCQQSHKYDRVMNHLEGMDEDKLTINQVLRLGGL